MDTAFLFLVIQWCAIVILFILFIYCKLQKVSEMQKYVSMLVIASILMLMGYSLEMVSPNIESAYFGTILSYVGEPFVLVSALMLIRTFYGRRIFKLPVALMLIFAAFITVLVLTNSFHHLYYLSVSFDANAIYSPLVFEHGPLYYLNIILSSLYSVAIVAEIIVGFLKSKSPLKKRLTTYTMLMVLVAIAGFVSYFLKVIDGYDTTMLGLSIGVLFLTVLFFRCRIFDVVDMAKDYALDISTEGLLVYDDAKSIAYENNAAKKVVGEIIPESFLEEMEDGESSYIKDQNAYSVNANTIRHRGDYLGRSIEIHDITEAYHYQDRLERTVKATTEKLENIQRTIFGSFASLVEARSLETGDHIRRVSNYTKTIAENLRSDGKYTDILTDEYIDILVDSAPLHDLGKISISDTILLKPGKLTAEEFDIMKTHAASGERIIRSTMTGLEAEEYVKMAAEIALCHHERWDGTGYPNGLKGEEIPLSARIVAVADCYDAMTSKRCYKDAYPDEKALGIIQEESGTHFDPDVVQAFMIH